MSLSIRHELFASSKIKSEEELRNAAMSGNDKMVISLFVTGAEVQDYRTLVEVVDELGHRNTSAIIKKYYEQPWLFGLLKAYQLSDHEKWYSAILSMSQNRIIMLEKIASQLLQNGKFNEESLAAVIVRLAHTNKHIEKVAVEKIKMEKRSIFKSNSEILFFHDRQAIKSTPLYGTRGKVTKGFIDQHATEPLCAIKWMESIEYAEREARCQQRLGRVNPYILFYKSKVAVVLEWQQGKNLGQYTEMDFISHPFIRRMKCLIGLLIDLNRLHASLHCHNDLNGGNVMLDLSSDKMTLIDFELACKPHDMLVWQGDMSSLGEIIDLMFPEIKQGGRLNIMAQAIFDLRDALLWKSDDFASMPTSEQALEYCCEIVARADDLNDDVLRSIADRTINRTQPTLEDMVRTCERSKVMTPH